MTARAPDLSIAAMSRACGALLIIVAGLGLSPLGVRAAHADKLRILVLDVEGPSLTPASRSTLAQGLMTGLSASGVDAVRAADLASPGANGRGCADAACWGRLLTDRALAPAYVVRSTVSVAGSTYQLRVEMLDPRTSKVIEARDEPCEICTDAEAAEALGMAASALKAAVVKRNPEGAGAGGSRGARTPALAVPVASLTAPSSAAPSARAEISGAVVGKQGSDVPGSVMPTVLGWALVGAGAAAIVAGIVLVTMDGETIPSSCPAVMDPDVPCSQVHGTKVGGFVALGSGLAAGLVGSWILLTGPTATDGRVASADGWSLTLKRAF